MDEQMANEARALEQQGFINDLADGPKPLDSIRRGRFVAFASLSSPKGYLAAQVIARRYGKGEVVRGSACSENAMYGLTIKELDFDIEKGARTTVSGILLMGNLATKNYILRDELLMSPGSELGSDELFISQANLRSLGDFDAVNVSYISQESNEVKETIGINPAVDPSVNNDRKAMVLVTVEESKAVLLDLYVGLQIDSTPIDDNVPILYRVGTSARTQNLLGYALELGVGANHSNRMSDVAKIEDDYAVWRAGPFFKNRRLLGTRLSLAVEALFERGRTVQGDQYQAVYNAEATISYDFYNLSYPSRWGRGLVVSLRNEFSENGCGI